MPDNMEQTLRVVGLFIVCVAESLRLRYRLVT